MHYSFIMSNTITFYKYQGTGNDFVIIDNRQNTIHLTKDQVALICDRRFGIGADGLMLLNKLEGYHFAMKYYNADGNESTMCGNGGRCLSRFAKDCGIEATEYTFLAIDGEHQAVFSANGWVELKMNDILTVNSFNNDFVLNTGSPHYIKKVEDVQSVNVFNDGKSIRNSPSFIKEGINVNFVEVKDNGLFVRTYERGVENETLSCGTGVTASAIALGNTKEGFNDVAIETLGGNLKVKFNAHTNGTFTDVWLCGPAEFVFKGQIELPI